MGKTSTNKAKGKKNRPKNKLGIPDLEHSKAAVLRSLVLPTRGADTSMLSMSSSPGTVRNLDWPSRKQWFCGIGFTWRIGPRARTINVRMAAVRRLAYEAADSGLLSPELTAGIYRVKVFASWALVWATGLRPARRRRSGR
jgi:hypothetical protein